MQVDSYLVIIYYSIQIQLKTQKKETLYQHKTDQAIKCHHPII